jgi:hypothetical protein
MRLTRITSLAVLLGLFACGSDGTDGGGGTPTVTYNVSVLSTSGSVPDPSHSDLVLNLEVRTAQNQAVPGAVIRLQATTGSLAAATLTTDAIGKATATWTLPLPLPAAYSLSACSTSPADATCTYLAIWAVP